MVSVFAVTSEHKLSHVSSAIGKVTESSFVLCPQFFLRKGTFENPNGPRYAEVLK